jgi:delta24-sterol reductase
MQYGEIVMASPVENEDLFYGSAATFGTVGVTTLFELR